MAASNVVRLQSTWFLEYPSLSAMAYTKADSYPLPLSGLLSITHGSYAGSPVATVSLFVVTVSWVDWEEELDPPQALVPVSVAMVNNAAARRMKCDERDNGHLGLLG